MKLNPITVAIALGLAIGSAAAQTAPADNITNQSMAMPVSNPPSPHNPGTLAESANTTALASPTYHQGNGLFDWFDHHR